MTTRANETPPAARNWCRIHSLVSVDERGQMVLPKNLRESAGIGPGDKLALVTWENEGEVCCLALIKADRISELLQGVLGPFLGPVTSR